MDNTDSCLLQVKNSVHLSNYIFIYGINLPLFSPVVPAINIINIININIININIININIININIINSWDDGGK